MKFSMIKGLIGAVAPTLGAALGTPIAGAAVQVLTNVLGCKADEKSIEQAMSQASAEDLAKIREAELEFDEKMKQMDVDVFALETADNQDARKHFAKDWTARAISIGSMLAFIGYIFLVTIQPPNQDSEAVTNLILGYLGGTISAIVSYYFGSSEKKNE